MYVSVTICFSTEKTSFLFGFMCKKIEEKIIPFKHSLCVVADNEEKELMIVAVMFELDTYLRKWRSPCTTALMKIKLAPFSTN